MATYGFDGVDIDWLVGFLLDVLRVIHYETLLHVNLTSIFREYPVAPERSGRPEDFANYPAWLTNLRAAFASSGRNYGLSITMPSSFWYLQNFDIVNLEKVVDWFNMMGKKSHYI